MQTGKGVAGSRRLLLLLFLFLSLLTAVGDSEGAGLLEQSKQQQAGVDNPRWVEEKLGDFLPLDLFFIDSQGEQVQLREIVDRPTIILPVYFYCPGICSKNLANLAIALNNLKSQPGRDYRVIALSFNSAEGAADAARAKRNYLKILDEGFPAEQWRFLTGSEEAIRAATDALGFRFEKVDDETFIHPAALITLAADGKIIRYVYGSFLAGDIDVGLADASSGRPSLSVKRLLDFCFNYDPRQNQSLFTWVKVVVLAVFAAALSFVLFSLKGRGRRSSPPASHRKDS